MSLKNNYLNHYKIMKLKFVLKNNGNLLMKIFCKNIAYNKLNNVVY